MDESALLPGMTCHGNFGPENFGPGDRNSTKMFRGISVLSWNLSPPLTKLEMTYANSFKLCILQVNSTFTTAPHIMSIYKSVLWNGCTTLVEPFFTCSALGQTSKGGVVAVPRQTTLAVHCYFLDLLHPPGCG